MKIRSSNLDGSLRQFRRQQSLGDTSDHLNNNNRLQLSDKTSLYCALRTRDRSRKTFGCDSTPEPQVFSEPVMFFQNDILEGDQ